MYNRLVCNKRSDTSAAVFHDAFEFGGSPCVLGSDNGGEFIGVAFTSLLRECGVIQWRTAQNKGTCLGNLSKGPEKGSARKTLSPPSFGCIIPRRNMESRKWHPKPPGSPASIK
jgi:hypothetical protein